MNRSDHHSHSPFIIYSKESQTVVIEFFRSEEHFYLLAYNCFRVIMSKSLKMCFIFYSNLYPFVTLIPLQQPALSQVFLALYIINGIDFRGAKWYNTLSFSITNFQIHSLSKAGYFHPVKEAWTIIVTSPSPLLTNQFIAQ